MNIARYAPICYFTDFRVPCALVWYLCMIIAVIFIWHYLTHKKMKDE